MAGLCPGHLLFYDCGICRHLAKSATMGNQFKKRHIREATMGMKALLLASTVLALTGPLPASGQAQTSGTLSGQVSSTEEGAMEGVLVSAKRDGSHFTTTVVSNDKGQFSFPAANLEPGKYSITIRAAGYTLSGPKTVDVGADGPPPAINLTAPKNLAPQ